MVASPITWTPWLLHRLVGDVVDLAPALVAADQVGLHRDGARALGRDQVEHVVLDRGRTRSAPRARPDPPRPRGRRRGSRCSDTPSTPRGRARSSRRCSGWRRARSAWPGACCVLRYQATSRCARRARAGSGRPTGGMRQHEHAAVGHGCELAGRAARSAAPPSTRGAPCPGSRASPSTCSHWKSTPGETMRRSYCEIALADAHALVSGSMAVAVSWMHHHAVLAQAVVAEREALDGADARQDEVAEGTGDELAIGLEQHHLDAGIGQAHVLRRGGPAPAAADRRRPAGPSLGAKSP